MQREPSPAFPATSRLFELAEEEVRHRRLLRLGLAVALWLHLGLLLVPFPTHSVAVAEKDVVPVVHLVPLPPISPPPPPRAVEPRRPGRFIAAPTLLPSEPTRPVEDSAHPPEDETRAPEELAWPGPPQPEPDLEPAGPIYVGGAVAQPRRLVFVEPVYPPAARTARLPGLVILQVLLGKDGTVREVKVLRPGSLGMTESAEAAVRQWRWEPALLNGQPVEALMTVTVTFVLP